MTSKDLDPLVVRQRINAVTRAASDALPWPVGLVESSFTAAPQDGASFEVHRFLPKTVSDARSQRASSPEAPTKGDRAIIFAFGGGMIAGNVEVFRGFIATLAQLSDTQVFAPQWRIAPEHPFPAGVEDVYSTLLWLQDKADDFHIDPARIILFGMSAGGCIATSVALMARDKGLDPPPVGLCLRYAMLDDQASLGEISPRHEKLSVSTEMNDFCWKTYLGGLEKRERNDKNTPAYASPARAKNFASFPPTHIGVGDFDLFRDENVRFATNLTNAPGGAGVELHVYPGVPHGFDGVPSKMRDEMWGNEARFIQKW